MKKVLETVKEHYIDNLKYMYLWDTQIANAQKSNDIEKIEIYRDIRNDYVKAALTLFSVLDEYLTLNEIEKMHELARDNIIVGA